MASIIKDVYQVGRLFEDIKYSRLSSRNDYNVIYFSSNERLRDIFSNYELRNKRCLTSIGSGDQAFHLLNRGARSVDVFDINKFAIYYYYLRRWCIEYLNKYYPNNSITNVFIIDLIICVNPRSEDEKNALEFWKRYVCCYCDYVTKNIVCRGEKNNLIPNLDKLQRRMKDNFNCYNVDITNDISCIDSKYDYIFKSNISEYVHDKESLIRYRDNLYSLLKDNGKVISTFIMSRSMPYYEYEVFKDKFEVEDLPLVKVGKRYESVGYTLIKK